MSTVDYFIAADDEDALRALRGAAARGFDTVTAAGIDPAAAIARLEAILTDRTYTEVTSTPRHCRRLNELDWSALLTDAAADSTGVVTVTDTLRDALAAADPPRLRQAAQRWAETGETAGRTADDLAAALDRIAALARTAVGRGHRLYCRWAA